VKKTAAGLWFQAWLNRRDEYESYILKMIELRSYLKNRCSFRHRNCCMSERRSITQYGG